MGQAGDARDLVVISLCARARDLWRPKGWVRRRRKHAPLSASPFRFLLLSGFGCRSAFHMSGLFFALRFHLGFLLTKIGTRPRDGTLFWPCLNSSAHRLPGVSRHKKFEPLWLPFIRRLIHISITHPDRSSDLPYFRGKAELEEHIKEIGMSYAILRPAVLFGKEDILINNIAWALRTLPVFGTYGDGRYRLQPIYVDDLAAAAVARVEGDINETIDAIGPETFRYRGLVEMIAREIGSRALIVPTPPWLAFLGVRMLGWMVGDVINTRDEVKGLMQERLYVDLPPLGTTKLSDWVHAHREKLGRQYASELQRRFDRVSPYRPN